MEAETAVMRGMVGMTDKLVLDSNPLAVSVDDTVVWVPVGPIGHSATAYEDEIPERVDYFGSGGFTAGQTTSITYTLGEPDDGDVPDEESCEHTFETVGTSEYFCIPHEASGIVSTSRS